MSELQTIQHENETFHILPVSRTSLILREPDPAILHIAGISIFGLVNATSEEEKKPDLPDIPEGEGEIAEKLRIARQALEAGVDKPPPDPKAEADRLARLTADMMRLVVWLCAGYLDADGKPVWGGLCFERTEGRIPVRNLSDDDLVSVWDWAIAYGRKEAQGRPERIEALRDFLQIAKRAASCLPSASLRQIRRNLDRHFNTGNAVFGG